MAYKYTLEGTSAALLARDAGESPAALSASEAHGVSPLQREDQVRTVPGRVIFIQNMFNAAASFNQGRN